MHCPRRQRCGNTPSGPPPSRNRRCAGLPRAMCWCLPCRSMWTACPPIWWARCCNWKRVSGKRRRRSGQPMRSSTPGFMRAIRTPMRCTCCAIGAAVRGCAGARGLARRGRDAAGDAKHPHGPRAQKAPRAGAPNARGGHRFRRAGGRPLYHPEFPARFVPDVCGVRLAAERAENGLSKQELFAAPGEGPTA